MADSNGREISDRIFGKVPPKREREREVVEVEKLVSVPLLYDVEIDGYWMGNFGITDYGIYIREEADERQWYDACMAANKITGGRDWGKADLCLFAMEILNKTPEEIAPLIEKMTPASVITYASVSRSASDREIRLAAPSMAHFRLVMALKRDEQMVWLRQANEGKWSVSKLRAALDQAAGKTNRKDDENQQRRALKAQQKAGRLLVNKAMKLAPSLRQEMALYLRQLADKLEIQGDGDGG